MSPEWTSTTCHFGGELLFSGSERNAHKEGSFSGWINCAIESSFLTNSDSHVIDRSLSQDGDIFVSPDHPIHSSLPWTQQSQGCGRPGDFVYLPRSFVEGGMNNAAKSAEERGSISGDNGNQSTAQRRANNTTAMRIGDEIR